MADPVGMNDLVGKPPPEKGKPPPVKKRKREDEKKTAAGHWHWGVPQRGSKAKDDKLTYSDVD